MKQQLPLWVHGTLLVESEMLNRPRRRMREALAMTAGAMLVMLMAMGASCA